MRGRTSLFDWLRLAGALLVLIGHSFALLGRDVPLVLSYQIHTLGVMLFFLISGYLIAGSWRADPRFLRYAEKRARRIMPALLVVVALTALVVGPVMTRDADYWTEPATWTYLWRNMILLPYHTLPGVFEGNPVRSPNGSLWTLPVEVFMYVLTPALVRAGPWVCVAAGLALIVHPLSAAFGGMSLVGASSVVPYFLFGAALKLLGAKMPASALPSLPVDLSFGIYLTAFPVQQVIVAANPHVGVAALTLQTLAVTAPLAWLSWTFVERPAMTPLPVHPST